MGKKKKKKKVVEIRDPFLDNVASIQEPTRLRELGGLIQEKLGEYKGKGEEASKTFEEKLKGLEKVFSIAGYTGTVPQREKKKIETVKTETEKQIGEAISAVEKVREAFSQVETPELTRMAIIAGAMEAIKQTGRQPKNFGYFYKTYIDTYNQFQDFLKNTKTTLANLGLTEEQISIALKPIMDIFEKGRQEMLRKLGG